MDGRPDVSGWKQRVRGKQGWMTRKEVAGRRTWNQSIAQPIRKASLFARERKRDSEEEVLLKMADLGGGRHPVSAVRSKQLTRRAFWADPTIHYFSQVAVESREGSEELTIAQAHCLGGPDNSLLGPGRRRILLSLSSLLLRGLQTVKLIDISAEKLI